MKRMAMIKDGIVENIAVWDGISNWRPEGYQFTEVPEGESVDIGYIYKNRKFFKN